MGKIRRTRQKLHLQAVKPDKHKDKEDPLKPNESSLPSIFPTSGLFDAVDGSKEKHNQQSIKNLSKKDRRKERHERFLKKLHASKLVEESAKNAKERAKTAVVGDMEPLLSALPVISLPVLVNGSSTHNKSANKERTSRNKMSRKARQAMQANEIAHFQEVLNHPAYKANPLAAISEHIKNAVQREHENQT